MKVGFVPFALAASVLCLAAAAPLQSKVVHFTTGLTGASEVPANATTGNVLQVLRTYASTRAGRGMPACPLAFSRILMNGTPLRIRTKGWADGAIFGVSGQA